MEMIHPRTRAELRTWLARNHVRDEGVWVATYKKSSAKQAVTYDDVVEELLCVGWIDSKTRSLDDERTSLWACPRRPKSPWSPSNVARVERLERDGLMRKPGRAAVAAAKRDGRWPA